MSPRLEWHVGQGADEDVLVAVAPEAVVPRRGRRSVLTPQFLTLYLAALLCAGWVGFGLGRWSEARTALSVELDRQVAVESAAWRAADADLLASTLAPTAPAVWREAQLLALQRNAPLDYQAEVESFEILGSDQAHVIVRVTTPTGQHDEVRLYRAVERTWYRAPDD